MNIEKMKRHLGKPIKLKLGEDIFHILPLPVEYIPEFFGGIISKMHGTEEAEILKSMDSDMIEVIKKLIYVSCERSPDIDTNDKEVLDQFVSANFVEFMGAMIEVNMPSIESKDAKVLHKMKKKHEKNTGAAEQAKTTGT